MKIHLRYTSRAEQWEAITQLAVRHGLEVYKVGDTEGISEWTLEANIDAADLSNFANELGCLGVLATASPVAD